jgi:hypothetical protein
MPTYLSPGVYITPLALPVNIEAGEKVKGICIALALDDHSRKMAYLVINGKTEGGPPVWVSEDEVTRCEMAQSG